MTETQAAYNAAIETVKTMEDGYSTGNFDTDSETTCEVDRDGDTYTLSISCVDSDSKVWFSGSEAYTLDALLGALGALAWNIDGTKRNTIYI